MQKRIVALDIGLKRIGVAVSDPFNSYALPDNAYICTQKLQQDIENILQIIKDKMATEIVCGLPINADGSESIQTTRTKRFLEALRQSTHLPVYTVDERYTSLEAKERLGGCGAKKKGQKERQSGKVDSVAACCILEEYLNQSKRKSERNDRE